MVCKMCFLEYVDINKKNVKTFEWIKEASLVDVASKYKYNYLQR